MKQPLRISLLSICMMFLAFHFTSGQSFVKVGSGVYQFSNYDPALAKGLSFSVGHQFNSEKIPRLGLITGIGFDYLAGITGDGISYTMANGTGMSLSSAISFAVIQREKFEWRINNGIFLSHYGIRFQRFTETNDGIGNRTRTFLYDTNEIGSAIGYQLSTSLLFKLRSGKWIFFNPFEWQIAPDGYARINASIGLRF